MQFMAASDFHESIRTCFRWTVVALFNPGATADFTMRCRLETSNLQSRQGDGEESRSNIPPFTDYVCWEIDGTFPFADSKSDRLLLSSKQVAAN